MRLWCLVKHIILFAVSAEFSGKQIVPRSDYEVRIQFFLLGQVLITIIMMLSEVLVGSNKSSMTLAPVIKFLCG